MFFPYRLIGVLVVVEYGFGCLCKRFVKRAGAERVIPPFKLHADLALVDRKVRARDSTRKDTLESYAVHLTWVCEDLDDMMI